MIIMGLDMYLTKKTYVGAEYEHRKVTGKISIKQNGTPIPIQFNRVSYIHERVGYWRKANQIHNWFVTHVQEGIDNCAEYDVSKEQVLKLLDACKKVKEATILKDGAITNGYVYENGVKMPIVAEGKEMVNPELASILLPTASGFFFGSTDYDEYYMDDINNTIKIMEQILSESDPTKDYFSFDLTYSASW
jgi:hypothetical protein